MTVMGLESRYLSEKISWKKVGEKLDMQFTSQKWESLAEFWSARDEYSWSGIFDKWAGKILIPDKEYYNNRNAHEAANAGLEELGDDLKKTVGVGGFTDGWPSCLYWLTLRHITALERLEGIGKLVRVERMKFQVI
jgi:hypothetical protein